MHVAGLGCAGIALEHKGASLVIDPLLDLPAGLYVALGDLAAGEDPLGRFQRAPADAALEVEVPVIGESVAVGQRSQSPV